MKALVEALPMPAVLLDAAGRVACANAAAGTAPGMPFRPPGPGWTRRPIAGGALWLGPDTGAAALAHDLRNLLCVMLAAAHGMGRLPDSMAEAERLAIRDAAERAREQVNRFLPGADPPVVAELGAALREAAPLLRRVLGPGVALRLDLPTRFLRLPLPRDRLDRALVNLAGNAREAMAGQGTFLLALRQEGAEAVIEARDGGPGFSPEALASAFQPFHTTRAGGTGLGLLAVREVAQEAGGRVEAINAPEGGAMVRLRLPLPPPTPGHGILLVEDEPALLRAARHCLEAAGHRVAAHADGEAALAWLRAGGAADLLVTDLSLPGLDGLSLARAARRLHRGLPVLILSGHGPERADFPHCFLPKPFSPTELESAVSQAISLAEIPS